MPPPAIPNVYAINLQNGRLLWRTQTPAANEALAMCGSSLLVNYQNLAALEPGHRANRVDDVCR